MLILSLIGFFITIAILVTFHEYGHFYFARLFGIHVKRFSVGFGKPIKIWISKKHTTALGATEYAIAAIPLGGFVQMAERPPEDQTPNHAEAWITGTQPMVDDIPPGLAFQDKPAWQRAMVVAAGPLANFLLAIVLFASVYMIGNPTTQPVLGGQYQGFVVSTVNDQPVSRMKDMLLILATQQGEITLSGSYNQSAPETIRLPIVTAKSANPFTKYNITPWQLDYRSVIGNLVSGSPAEKAKLALGDEITSLAERPVERWSDISDIMRDQTNQAIPITILRNGDSMTLSITPEMINQDGEQRLIIGIQPDSSTVLNLDEAKQYEFVEHYNPLTALAAGFTDTWRYTATTYTFLKQMLFGQQSLKNLGGPITIADVAGNTLSAGIRDFIIFLGIVSLSLGFLNLLPIPVLDGGHLLLIAIETLTGRPVSQDNLRWYYRIGLVLIGIITIIALTNDVMRLFI